MNLGIVTRLAGRASLVLSKHAPTILTAAGTVGFIGTTVLASKATLKVEETIAEEAALLVKVHEAHEDGKLTDKDATRDKVILYTRMSTKLGKLYAPALILGAASIASLITGHGIMLKRNASLAAAYAAVDQAFKTYKKKIEAKFGKDAVLDALVSTAEEDLTKDEMTLEAILTELSSTTPTSTGLLMRTWLCSTSSASSSTRMIFFRLVGTSSSTRSTRCSGSPTLLLGL